MSRTAPSPLPPSTPSRRGEQILETFEDLVLSRGFARLNVSTIAQQLSCSKRTLYELAPSRDDLILRVIERFFARIRSDATLAVLGQDDPRQRIYRYLQVGAHAAERLSAAAVADIHAWAPARAIWQKHVRLRVDGLTEIIEAGIRARVFRSVPPAFVAEVVFAAINRLREPEFYRSTDLAIAEAFDELYAMLIAALTTAADSAPALGGGARAKR